jgi:hypothetical protein
MDLFGKKKPKAVPPPAAPAPQPEAKPAADAPKPAYVPKAAEEIHEVEKNIDFFLERKSTLGIMERYKEKYGEDLSPPVVTDGVKYKYTFAEEKPAAKKQVASVPGATATAATATTTAAVKPGAPAPAAATAKPATGAAVAAPATAGLSKAFASLTSKEEGGAAARPAPSAPSAPAIPKAPAPPGFFYSGEERPITGDAVMLCLFGGKPFFAWRGFLKYKCRNPPPIWMMIVGELPLFPVTLITGIVRLPARGIYEVVQASKRRKAEKAKYEAEYEERRRLAYEKRLAGGAPPAVRDEYDYDYSPKRRPPPRRGPPPPRGGRRRRPMRA